MSPGVRWWWSPAALLALTATLCALPGDAEPVVEPAARPSEVQVRDASGRRQPFAWSTEGALVLELPAEFAGQRVQMKVWRRVRGAREPAAWLTLRPRVGADGTIPMAGLAAGDYAVEVTSAHGEVLTLEALSAPGRYAFGAATPPR